MNWLELMRSYKVSDTPLLDYLGTVFLCMVIAYFSRIPVTLITIILFILYRCITRSMYPLVLHVTWTRSSSIKRFITQREVCVVHHYLVNGTKHRVLKLLKINTSSEYIHFFLNFIIIVISKKD